jgi:hypothetical protein
MEVQLRGVPGSGADKTYALSTQARGGRLGVLLQTTDGGPRYMLSDSVSGVDLAPDEFIGRVRPCVNTRRRRDTVLRCCQICFAPPRC